MRRLTAAVTIFAFLTLTGIIDAALGAATTWHKSQASWYGPGFYGHRTACGQTLTSSSNWVAHKYYRCGTRLIICYRRCVRTIVADRGPYVAGRTFDLAPGLKAATGFSGKGTVTWRLGH